LIEPCFVKVEFDPATSGNQVRSAVSGFLRYIQHRDLHPTSSPVRARPDVAGLVKYVAYRDRASERAELFGAHGSLGTEGRKDFVAYVIRSIDGSQPQLFRTRAGIEMDRRRAVSRFLISPGNAVGLDLKQLARAAVSRLESDMGVSGLRWIAAVHRNTSHYHVHLVLAGMHEVAEGQFRRVDISKRRLAAIKEAVGLEVERQRGEQTQVRPLAKPVAAESNEPGRILAPTVELLPAEPALVRKHRLTRAGNHGHSHAWRPVPASGPLSVLRTVARRYSRQMERELEQEARRIGRERAA
jgi:hypothetical protein